MLKVFLLFFCCFGSAIAQIETTKQLIIAVAPDWNSTTGTMYLFEMSNDGWIQSNMPWKVNFGDSGLVWAEGIHENPDGVRMKVEGDHRSPAGVFELGDIYGYGAEAPSGVTYPYHQSTRTLHAVDDRNSVFYNSLVDENDVVRDSTGHLPWKSSEHMVIDSVDYKFTIPVRMNPQAIPGKGSCIFLHLESISAPATLGCTSMAEPNMIFLMQWLNLEKKPLLVQLPKAEFMKYLVEWHLPVPSRN